jgi:hypothetical protein
MTKFAFKNFFAVMALTLAVAGAADIRPAGAVVFIFKGVCNDSVFCDPGMVGAGAVGVGTAVTGTLVINLMPGDPALMVDEPILISHIDSFSLAFDTGPIPDGTIDSTFDFDFTTGMTTPSVGVNDKYVNGPSTGLLAIGLLNLTDSLDNFFSYNGAEGGATWLLASSDPAGLGAGEEPPVITFDQFGGAIPEPGSLITFMLGAAGLLFAAHRRRRATPAPLGAS